MRGAGEGGAAALEGEEAAGLGAGAARKRRLGREAGAGYGLEGEREARRQELGAEIGRASCRERVS